MPTRRSLARLLAATPFAGLLAAKPKLSDGNEILRSFDGREWARHFVAHAKAIPGLATDEETMTGWFANALMRGYDERRPQIQTHYVTHYRCGCSATSHGPDPLPDYCSEHK
jgi:hypothetical protein